MRNTFFNLIFLVMLSACSSAQSGLPTQEVTLINGIETHKFTAELATNNQQRKQGLMFRTTLPQNGAMLFLWPEEKPKPRQFWMKNTPLPLTIIYAYKNEVKHIIRRAEPYSTQTLGSITQPIDAVLEISAEHPTAQKIQLGWILNY